MAGRKRGAKQAGNSGGDIPPADTGDLGGEIIGSVGEAGTIDPIAILNSDEQLAIGTASDGAASDGTPGGDAPRKRGWPAGKPRGPRNKTQEKATNLIGLEDLIFSLHLGMSGAFKTPELELDEQEAAKVTEALSRLSAHYNIAPTETQKVWMNFVGAMGAVYGSRLIALSARKRKEAADKKRGPAPVSASVVEFPPGFRG